MPNPTYRVSSDVQPYSIDNALLAIANPITSGKVVLVKEINVNFQGAQSEPTAATPGIEALALISSHDGGSTVPINSLDSADTLPSQVEARTDSTITVTDTLRRSVAIYQFGQLRVPFATSVNGSGAGFGNFCGIQQTLFASDATGPILREGEGVAWYVPAGLRPPSTYWLASITFKTSQAGNPTFMSQVVYNPISDTVAGFSLMNNTGSGVVLTVINFEVHEVGTDSQPHFSFIQIDDIDPAIEGTTPTIRKFDSENPDVPSSIMIRRNCAVFHVGKNRGWEQTGYSPDFSSGISTLQWSTPLPHWYRSCRGGGKFRSYMAPPCGINKVHFGGTGRWMTKIFDGTMVVRPGEGIAVMCGLADVAFPGWNTGGIATCHGNSSYSNFFINIQFQVEDQASPGYAA